MSPFEGFGYFTEFTYSKGIFYLIVVSYLFLSCVVVIIELFIDHGCDESYNIKYENPSYHDTPCRHTRYPYLLYLTPDECGYGRRLASEFRILSMSRLCLGFHV